MIDFNIDIPMCYYNACTIPNPQSKILGAVALEIKKSEV